MDEKNPNAGLPGHLGMEISDEGDGWLEMTMLIDLKHLRPGIPALHAGAIVSLSDSACGFACTNALHEKASSFTTIELKANLLGTAADGHLICRTEVEHLGHTTQI